MFYFTFFGQVFLMLYQPNVMHINQLFRCNKNSTTHNRAITGQRSLQPHALLKIHHNCYGLRSQHRLVVDSFVRAVNKQYTVTCGGAEYLRQPIWFCSFTQKSRLHYNSAGANSSLQYSNNPVATGSLPSSISLSHLRSLK